MAVRPVSHRLDNATGPESAARSKPVSLLQQHFLTVTLGTVPMFAVVLASGPPLTGY